MKFITLFISLGLVLSSLSSLSLAFGFLMTQKTSSYQEQTAVCLIVFVSSSLLFFKLNRK
jgi:hypothetical protein